MATTYVSNFLQLRDAIEDGDSTEIIVQEDIIFLSGGAKINAAKGEIIIDFGGHNVTDVNSSNFTDAIYIAASSPQVSVTVKNAVWSGRNYYGVVGVYDGNTLATINLEKINYKGPQFVYNKSGTTRISDSVVVLDKNESNTNPQEFCETNRLFIGGNVVVNSNTTSNAVVWFTGTNSALTVEENAYFEVNALSSYFFYTDTSPDLTFKKGSKTFIITNAGLFYGAGSSSHIATSFVLEEDATFSSTRNSSNSVPMFKVRSNMTIGKNASFSLYSPSAGTSALIYFGIAANLSITSPKSVILYNNGANVFSFQTGNASTPNTLAVDAEMLRLWSAATTPVESAGGLDDTPTSEYHKANYASNLTATFKLSSSAILSAENNLVEGDACYPIDTSTPLLSSKVIAMGEFALSLNPLNDSSTSISGSTRSTTPVRATLLEKTLSATSSGSGTFSIALDDKLAIGTEVKIVAGKDFLSKQFVVESEGSVSLTKVDPLAFRSFSEMPRRDRILRINPNWELEVTDTRQSGGDWYLYAHINAPLSSDGERLADALVFSQNNTLVTLSGTPSLIFSGTWKDGEPVTKISWKNTEGFLLSIDPQKDYIAGDYSTNIEWQITTSPL